MPIAFSIGQEKTIITLHDHDAIIGTSEYPYYIFEDKTNNVSIEALLKNQSLLTKTTEFLPDNKNRTSTYWVKFPIIDSSSFDKRWIFEIYNYRIDSVEFYIIHDDSIIFNIEGGDHYLFNKKNVPHKNFAYHLPTIKNDTVFCYIKGKSKLKMDFFSVIKSVDFFIQYSNTEYYLLGMLYGILTILLLYNFIYLIIFRELLYFYYLLAIIGFIIYFMTKDGTGFEFIWYKLPAINDYLPSFSLCFAIISQLLFTKIFFKDSFYSKKVSTLFYLIILSRLLYLAVEVLADGKIIHLMSVDIPIIAFIFWMSIKNIKQGEAQTYYFPLGTLFFLIGFSSTALYEANANLLPYSILIIYGSTIGVVAQIVTFWVSLSFRHRQIFIEQKNSEYKLKLKNIDFNYLQKYKRELEIAVHDATNDIQKKSTIILDTNKNLETFIYKSSHNLRGPLSSIMGLFTISLKENNETKLRELLQHMYTSAISMEQELLLVTRAAKISSHELVIENLNLYKLIQQEFKSASILLHPSKQEAYNTKSDRWLAEEVIRYLKAMHLKLASDPIKDPVIELSNQGSAFECKITFKSAHMKAEYIKDFFTPYHKDISHLFELHTEPYLCKAIMTKLRGKITIELMPNGVLSFTLHSKY